MHGGGQQCMGVGNNAGHVTSEEFQALKGLCDISRCEMWDVASARELVAQMVWWCCTA